MPIGPQSVVYGARIILVAPNASARLGGEAIIPFHYFRLLIDRDIDVHLVTHVRNRAELMDTLPGLQDRMHFTLDNWLIHVVEHLSKTWPESILAITAWPLIDLISGFRQRRTVKRLVRQAGPIRTIVHETTPVSPRRPSLMWGFGAPVVIGPLNGGMSYPPALRGQVRLSERVMRVFGRPIASISNLLLPGKIFASLILVANERTYRSLPSFVNKATVQYMVENGVDLDLYSYQARIYDESKFRIVFLGRLVDWKRVDIAIKALAHLPENYTLDIVGDGYQRSELEQLARREGVASRIAFHGFLSQAASIGVLQRCDSLILPSVYECGGAVVLEAMSLGLPVIATDWGGPSDYILDQVTGSLVPPTQEETMVKSFQHEIEQLGKDRPRAEKLGLNGRSRVEDLFSWKVKIDRILEFYESILANRRPTARRR